MFENGNNLGPLAALLSSLTWAVGSSTLSRIARTTNPLSVNFTRASIALPAFLLTVFVIAGGNLSEMVYLYTSLPPERFMWFFISVIASYGVGDIFFLLSSRHLGITTALAIASASPLVNVLFDFFQGKILLPLQWCGLLLTLGSVIWVIIQSHRPSEDQLASGTKKSFWLGVTLATITAFSWALNSLSVSKGAEGISAALGNSIRMIFALIVITILYLAKFRSFPRFVPSSELKKSWWIFLMESFGGSLLYVYGMSRSPLVLGSTLAALAPVIAVPVSLAMGLEKFSLKKTMAIILVVVGIYLLSSSR